MNRINLSNKRKILQVHYEYAYKLISKRMYRLSAYPDIKLFVETNIKTILVGMPNELTKINNEFNKSVNKKFTDLKDIEGIKILIAEVFDYDAFSRNKLGAYRLAQSLGVNVCPYCNRQYTNTVIVKKGECVTRPEFDHFYCKDTFPLLSLSFYNLIPSCKICNSNCKGTADFSKKPYMHPYMDHFGNDGKFTYLPSDITFYTKKDPDKVKILIDIKTKDLAKREQIENNCEVFHINDIYTQSHVDLLCEIIKKSKMYTPDYLDFLSKKFPDVGTKAELYRLLFSNYYNHEDHNMRPLSKFTRDIVDELGIFTK